MWYRDAGGTMHAIRLEDAPAGAAVSEAARSPQPAGEIALIAASISAGDAISS